MSNKIYTKTGDLGKTSLIGGTKVPKSHLRIESYGSLDELNSHIGLIGDLLTDEEIRNVLKEIQDRLFTIGSSLACDPEKEPRMKLPDLNEKDVSLLENKIDNMNEVLPEMKSFILPGGSLAISSIHVARCVCRRAERACVRLGDEGHYVDSLILKYLNRLSDYLFVLARYVGYRNGIPEVLWRPRLTNKNGDSHSM